jgi:uncharacterized Zn finger protein
MGFKMWGPYVSKAEKMKQARKKQEALKKSGFKIQTVNVPRKITQTPQGHAWLEMVEDLTSDSGRQSRAKTLARGGAILHLAVTEGKITAIVQGSDTYDIEIEVSALSLKQWQTVAVACGKKATATKLLSTTFNPAMIEVIFDQRKGLLPSEQDLDIYCSCPDYSTYCKHALTCFYAVSSLLDENPSLLFTLRSVPLAKFMAHAQAHTSTTKRPAMDKEAISEIFGIDLS